MPAPASRHHQELFPAYLRFPAFVLAYALLKPFLWLVDIAGCSDRVWSAVGRKMRQQLIEGNDFGDYQPTQHDVIVCTYPKCGTNWTMQIAYQIAMRGQGEFEHINDVIP